MIFAETKEDTPYIIQALQAYEKWGLKRYRIQKNEVHWKRGADLSLENDGIKNCDKFKCVGSVVIKRVTCDEDIDNKVAIGEHANRSLRSLIWNKRFSQETRKGISTV